MTSIADERASRRPTVIHFTDAAEFGGAERMIVTLMAGLPAHGWHSVLVHHGGRGIRRLLDEAKSLGVETHVVPPMHGSARWRTAVQFARQLRRSTADLFHAHLSSPSACRHALIAARLAGLPVVATVQLYIPVTGVRAVYPQRILSLGVDRYIAVSHEVARRMRPLCIDASRKLRVVYNGVPVEEFARHREEPCAGTLAPTVLAVARLHRQKGLTYLLRAATLLPNVRFLVAGDGPERSVLDDEVRTLGLGDRVRFLGERNDVAALLTRADVFVLPSLYEGLPLSVLEAMAAGTPVVATAVGGTDEAVADGDTGLLVPPCDPEALAMAIRTVLSDRTLARELVTKGKARVASIFAAENVARGVSGVYNELFPKGRDGGSTAVGQHLRRLCHQLTGHSILTSIAGPTPARVPSTG